MKRFLGTPFGLAVLGLLVLAGWAVWSAHPFEGAVARHVRSSSIYVVPDAGATVDQTAAAHIIGNRRLVVAFLSPGADYGDECDGVKNAADNTIVLFVKVEKDELDHYGCSNFPGGDDENFGKAFVAETIIASGADQFVHQPLEALKVIAINYDELVKAGIVPDGTRSIDPSLPRYLIAGAAVFAVLAGSAALYLVGRRLGGMAARRRAHLESTSDERDSVEAKTGVLAKQIIDLDGHYSRGTPDFRRKYRKLAADYADLSTGLRDSTVARAGLDKQVTRLTEQARSLTDTVTTPPRKAKKKAAK